jgi:hypothetical protein
MQHICYLRFFRGIPPVFDFALHFRCLQKATEALFEMSQASMAAGLALQERLNQEFGHTGHSSGRADDWMAVQPFSAFHMWLSYWEAATAPPQPMPLADIWSAWTPPAGNAFLAAPSDWSAFPFWQAMPMMPWSFYQAPLMAMMLTYGVPYSVAAPTARASTCAMDAADAACAQWRQMLASSNDSGFPGHMRRKSSTYLH